MSAVSRFIFPFEKKALAAACALVIANAAWAETLEERVQALEQTQSQQSEINQVVNELVGKINVSGFVSIRGGQIDDEDIIYLSTMDDSWSFSEESVVGLQVDSAISDQLAVSLQIKAASAEAGVELEWGYLEYAFEPDLKLRAGRLRAPGFMLSEFLDVGYAYPWVQVPTEVYGWLPFSRYEGMDLRYWSSIGGVDFRLNPYIGTTTNQQLAMGNLEFADQSSEFAGLDVQMTYDIFTVRAGYSKYHFNLSDSVLDNFIGPVVEGVTIVPDIPPYVDGVETLGLIKYVEDVMVGDGTPGSGVLSDVILGVQNDGDPTNDFFVPVLQAEQISLLAQLEPYRNIPSMNGAQDGEFYGVGFSADNGEFLLMSEYSSSAIEGIYPDVESGYVMFGYRFGNWMPHVTFAKMYTTNDDERPDIQSFEINELIWNSDPGLAQLASGLDAYTDGLLVTMDIIRLEQETVTLGVRWDPVESLAVKAEVFHVDLKNGSYGFAIPSAMLALSESNFLAFADAETPVYPEPADSVNGVRMSLDLVF